MRLSDSFRIDRPTTEVFDAFLDIERVATCLPGSQILGRPGEDTYDGEVKVKVGPLRVAYTGQLTVLDADRDRLRLTLRAKGREQRGAGNADAHVVAQLSEDGGSTRVVIDTELSVRGKVAQFGRGVITDVSAGIMRTFATNLEAMLVEGAPAGTAHQPTTATHATTAPAAETTAVGELDAWSVVRPILARHAGSITTVACSAVAAYLGARAGARRTRRGTAAQHHR